MLPSKCTLREGRNKKFSRRFGRKIPCRGSKTAFLAKPDSAEVGECLVLWFVLVSIVPALTHRGKFCCWVMLSRIAFCFLISSSRGFSTAFDHLYPSDISSRVTERTLSDREISQILCTSLISERSIGPMTKLSNSSQHLHHSNSWQMTELQQSLLRARRWHVLL